MPEPQSTIWLGDRRLVLCVGPGGVGKTTTAAALALIAAESGRRVAVVTIDPARRLAQALGIENRSSDLEHDLVPVLRGDAHLDALLLDGAQVFDAIVRACASTDEAATRILNSKIYRATAQRLGGGLEYAAMARVQMLHDAGDHDLIILDTPPTANALDFLDAPRRIRELIDNPAARMLAGTTRVGARVMGVGTAVVLRTLSVLGGGEFIRELGTFLREFTEVLGEFHRRGADFQQTLRSSATEAILITTASEFSAREAIDFMDQLVEYGVAVRSVILNRHDPRLPEAPPRSRLEEGLADIVEPAALADTVTRIAEAYAGARAQGERAAAARESIEAAAPGARVRAVGRRESPPQTLDDLRELGRELIGQG